MVVTVPKMAARFRSAGGQNRSPLDDETVAVRGRACDGTIGIAPSFAAVCTTTFIDKGPAPVNLPAAPTQPVAL
jgi:hypothetical protein